MKEFNVVDISSAQARTNARKALKDFCCEATMRIRHYVNEQPETIATIAKNTGLSHGEAVYRINKKKWLYGSMGF